MDHAPLCDYVEKQLKEQCSPKTISKLLVLDYPDDTRMRISHESLYQYVYAYKKKGCELYKGLRQGHKKDGHTASAKATEEQSPTAFPSKNAPPSSIAKSGWATPS